MAGRLSVSSSESQHASQDVGEENGTSRISELWRLDRFGYTPSYAFEVYKSRVGAALTLVSLTLLVVYIVITTRDYVVLPPLHASRRTALGSEDTITIAPNALGVQLLLDGQPFQNDSFFTVMFEQMTRGETPPATTLTSHVCTLSDERTSVDNILCLSERVRLTGSLGAERQGYLRCRVVPCTGSTCVDQTEWEETLLRSTLRLVMLETDSDVTRLVALDWRYVQGMAVFSDIVLQYMFVEKVARWAWDEDETTTVHLFKERITSLPDLGVASSAGDPFVGQVNVMLDSEGIVTTEEHISLLDLFASWGAQYAFQLFTIGFLAYIYNKNAFEVEFGDLDLRKVTKATLKEHVDHHRGASLARERARGSMFFTPTDRSATHLPMDTRSTQSASVRSSLGFNAPGESGAGVGGS